MNQKFQIGDKIRHKLYQIEYVIVAAKQGQHQFFYDLKNDNGEIVSDVPENELERA